MATSVATKPKPTLPPKKRNDWKWHAQARNRWGRVPRGAGVGALSDIPAVDENQALSNRDKKQRSEERGQDSKDVQNEQLQDHAANLLDEIMAEVGSRP